MYFKSVTLENIRSYERETVEFERGENLIFGTNGAGKSTILQGVFGGLFQTDIKYQVGNDFDLGELVRKQADDGRIELVFEAAGEEFTVEWVVEKQFDDDGEVSGAKTKYGYPTLSSPSLDEPISGVNDVQAEIERITGMSAESFVNSVYVQQGDITRLIHADTGTRREILDGLLGLDRMDEFVKRADNARLEFKSARKDAKTRRADTQKRLDELPTTDEIAADISEKESEVDDLDEEIAEYGEKVERLEDRKEENEKRLERIEELEEELSEAQGDLDDAESEHEKYKRRLGQKRSELSDLKDEIDELNDELAEARKGDAVSEYDLSSLDAARDALDDVDGELDSAKKEAQSIEEGKISNLQTELGFLSDDVDEAESEVRKQEEVLDELRGERADAEQELEAAEERVEQLGADIEAKHSEVVELAEELGLKTDVSAGELLDSEIPEAQQANNQRRNEVGKRIGELETLEEQVAELAETGQCPVCNASGEAHDIDPGAVAEEHRSELEEAKQEQEQIDQRDERLTELETAADELVELRGNRSDADDDVSELQSELDDIEGEVNAAEQELRELEAELDELEAEHASKEDALNDAKRDLVDARETVEAVTETRDAVESAVDHYETLDSLRSDIDNVEQNVENLRDLRQQAHSRMSELQQRVEDLESERGDIDADELESELDEIEGYIDDFQEKKEDAEAEKESLRDDIADLRAKQNQVEQEKERESMLTSQIEWADELVGEAEEIQEAYKRVRGKLRERNLAKLNKYTNEMFSELYQNQSYRGVRIDKRYNIHLVAADGELIQPELSSGGESTILNLALRAGVYRIIAERDGVAGAALPPFILDEPTTFLDEEHVGELQSMIDVVSEWNVPQVLVVSHDEQLIENSDNGIHVAKDPATETSHVVSADDGGASAD